MKRATESPTVWRLEDEPSLPLRPQSLTSCSEGGDTENPRGPGLYFRHRPRSGQWLGTGKSESQVQGCHHVTEGQVSETSHKPTSRFFVSQRIEQNTGKATVKGTALVKARRTLHRVGADTSKPVTLQLLFLGPEGKSSCPRAWPFL